MNYIDPLVDFSKLAATASQLGQSEIHHRKDIKLVKELHQKSMDLSKEQHIRNIQMEKRIFLMETFTDVEQHFLQLNADLTASNRECENDMFDQCNQSLQTVLLGNCIMFSSLSTVIFQGFLCGTPALNPNLVACTDVDPNVFAFYSLVSAISFAFLFISIVLCVEVILISTEFMYLRAFMYISVLTEAMKTTKDLMQSTNQRLAIVEDKLALEKCWSEHETAIHKRLDEQGKIIDSYLDPTKEEDTLREGKGNKVPQPYKKTKQQKAGNNFSTFWKKWCQNKQFYAVLFFYLGTGFMLLAVMIFMFVINSQTYLSWEGAILSSIIIGIFLLLSLWLAIYLPFYDQGGSSRLLKEEEEKDQAEEEKEKENAAAQEYAAKQARDRELAEEGIDDDSDEEEELEEEEEEEDQP